MKKYKINVALLREIQKQILKSPKQFRMWTWFVSDNSIPNCGTAACIAGWAIALKRKESPQKAYEWWWNSNGTLSPFEIGKRALKLTNAQAGRLFIPEHWPAQFHKKNADDAEQAVRRIDAFIKSGGKV